MASALLVQASVKKGLDAFTRRNHGRDRDASKDPGLRGQLDCVSGSAGVWVSCNRGGPQIDRSQLGPDRYRHHAIYHEVLQISDVPRT